MFVIKLGINNRVQYREIQPAEGKAGAVDVKA